MKRQITNQINSIAVRLLAVAVGAALLLVGWAARAQDAPNGQNALWIGHSQGLLKADGADGALLLSITDQGNVKSVALDAARGVVWAVSKNRLYGYNLNGVLLHDVAISRARGGSREERSGGRIIRGKHDFHGEFGGYHGDDGQRDGDENGDDVQHLALDVNPQSGSVWLAEHRRLYHFDSVGSLLETIELARNIEGISFDEFTEHLWVATKRRIRAYRDNGSVAREIRLPPFHRIQDLEVIDSNGDLWVAMRGWVKRYSATGTLELARPLWYPDHLTSDANGNLWLSNGKEILYWDSDGYQIAAVRPFSPYANGGKKEKTFFGGHHDGGHDDSHNDCAGTDEYHHRKGEKFGNLFGFFSDWRGWDLGTQQVVAMTADPQDGSVWVASKFEVAHVSAKGEMLHRLRKSDLGCVKIHDLELGPAKPEVPEISFDSPEGGSLVGSGAPLLEVSYAATAAAIDPESLAFESSGVFLPVVCDLRTQTSASCIPQYAFAPGPVEVNATIADTVGNTSEPAGVSFRVNAAPTIAGMPAHITEEGVPYSFTPVAMDPDIEFGDMLNFEIVNRPAWAGFDPATGELAGTPHNDDVGVYEDITIRVIDSFGAQALLEPFRIEVANVNDAPTLHGDPITVTDEDHPYVFEPTADDKDLIHGDILAFQIENLPSWASFDARTGVVSGTPENVDVGSYSGISISVTDLAGEAAVLPEFSITVRNLNDPPSISGTPDGDVDEDTAYDFVPNATDEDLLHGDTLYFEIVGLPDWLTFDPVNGRLAGVPAQADVGIHGPLVISVVDAQGASASLSPFTIEVLNVNDAPVMLAVQFVTDEDIAFNGTLTALDEDGDPIAFELIGAGALGSAELLNENTGDFRYVPLPDQYGTDSFQVRAFDSTVYSEMQTIQVAIAPVNDRPTASTLAPIVLDEDSVSSQQLLTGSDLESPIDELHAKIVHVPEHGQLSAAEGGAPLAITYNPDADFSGADSFGFLIEDPNGAQSPAVIVPVTVNPINDPPTALPTTIVIEEDAPPLLGELASNDPDGPAKRFEIVVYPTIGTLVLLNPFDGVFEFMPTAEASGVDSFSFRVHDEAGGIGEGTGSIIVQPVNDAPRLNGTPPITVVQDQAYSFIPEVTDDIVEGDIPPVLSVGNLPGWANFDPETGEISGIPGNAEVGLFPDLSITATDELGASTVLGPFSIEVVNLNDPPVIEGDPAQQVQVGDVYVFTPEASDPDLPHGELLTFEIAGLPVWADFDPATGTITGTPDQSRLGLYDDIVLSVVDFEGIRASLSPFSIEVTGENSPPEIVGIPLGQIEVGQDYRFTPIVFDDDLEYGDSLVFSVENLPGWAIFDPANGTISGQPQNADTGLYQGIVISATDSQGAADSLGAFSIEVLEAGAGGGGQCSPVANLTYPVRESLSLALSPNETINDILVEDVNLDGAPDIVVIGETFEEGGGECNPEVEECCLPEDEFCDGPGGGGPLSFVSVLAGNLFDGKPDGTFAAPVTTVHNGFFLAGELGDLDDDGLADLVVADPDVGLYVVTGTGSAVSSYFGFGQTLYSSRNPVDIKLVDLDGDGLRDILALGAGWYYPSGAIETYLNFGGLDLPLWNIENLVGYPVSFVEGDFNADPFVDVAVIHEGNYGNIAPGLQVLGGQDPVEYSAGDFFSASTLSLFDYTYGPSVTAGDFTGDGVLDLAYADIGFDGVGFARILSGAGDGNFSLGGAFDLGKEPSAITNADLNADGALDLVAANYFSNDGPHGTGTILIGESIAGAPTGNFALLEQPAVGIDPVATAVGDVNADGLGDLLFADNDYNLGPRVSLLPAQSCSEEPENTPPGIYGRPTTTIVAGTPYLFRPSVSDPDTDDIHEFSVSRLPSWASFDLATGEISGTPLLADVGDYGPIVVSVSDGDSDPASLVPFTITVLNDLQLILSGPSVVAQGASVVYTPTLTGAVSGRTLTYHAEALPAWLTLDAQTGEVTGTPVNGNVDTGFKDFDSLTLANPENNTILIGVNDGVVGAVSESIVVVVTNSNDPPVIGGHPTSIVPEGALYTFTPTMSDPDDDLHFPAYTDEHVFSVSNLPAWAGFAPETGTLSGVPNDVDVGVHPGVVISVSDREGATVSLPPFDLTVENVNEAPTLSNPDGVYCAVVDPNTKFCSKRVLNLEPGVPFELPVIAEDEDLVHEGETLTFSAENLPGWSSLDPSTGVFSGFPLLEDSGEYPAPVRFSVVDAAGLSDTVPSAFTVGITIIVNATPKISGTPQPSVYDGESYSFTPVVVDSDDTFFTFDVVNLPGWASFNPATGEISGAPGVLDLGSYTGISIRVSDHKAAPQSLGAFSIEVLNQNDPPQVHFDAGPLGSVTAQEDRELLLIAEASDPDEYFGDEISFGLENAPGWLSIDPVDGALRGTPGSVDIGAHPGVLITAQDSTGLISESAPFTVEVINQNDAPVMGGIPSTVVMVGSAYLFEPTISDEDVVLGLDSLEFTAFNLPHWLEQDPATGAISGVPAAEDVGVYPGIVLSVMDRAGAVSKLAEFDLTVSDGVRMPEVPVGPRLKLGAKGTLFDSVRFLYEGADALQTDLDPAVVEPGSVSVVRGQVRLPGGAPVIGAQVSAPGHPELGSTTTQGDGSFSFVVPGGALYLLKLDKTGYLPGYRRVQAPMQRFAWIEDVTLLPGSSQTHAVTGSASQAQVISQLQGGSATNEVRTNLVFPPNTDIVAELPDGSEFAISSGSLRWSDHSFVGMKALPGSFPGDDAIQAFTATFDEAQAMEATGVRFSRPVALYSELSVPLDVGSYLGSRYFDEQSGEWRMGEQGRVYAMVGVQAGQAQLDVDGDGNAEDAVTLGLDSSELEAIAAQFEPGALVTRVPIDHLSTWAVCYIGEPNVDYCRGVVRGLIEGPRRELERLTDFPVTQPSVQDIAGVVIEPENKSALLEEKIIGSPFSLVYSSDRAPGRSRGDVIVQLVPDDEGEFAEIVSRSQAISGFLAKLRDKPVVFTAELKEIELRATIAGKRYESTISSFGAGERVRLQWDGKDAYGRELGGIYYGRIVLGYRYKFTLLLARAPGPIDREVVAYTSYPVRVGNWDAGGQRLGGWSINAHHAYDAGEATIFRGDGSVHSLREDAPDAAEGLSVEKECEGDACKMDETSGVVGHEVMPHVIPPNSRYPRGFETREAKNSSGESVCLKRNEVAGLYIDEFGEPTSGLFIRAQLLRGSCEGGNVIYDNLPLGWPDYSYADALGILRPREFCPFSGLGSYSCLHDTLDLACVNDNLHLDEIRPGPDGQDLSALRMIDPSDVDIDEDGTLYVVDAGCNAVVQIDPAGNVTRVAGNNLPGFSGDGGGATQAQLREPRAIALSDDGSLYIADTGNRRIRRRSPAGTIVTVVGRGEPPADPDTGLREYCPENVAPLTREELEDIDGDGSPDLTETGKAPEAEPAADSLRELRSFLLCDVQDIGIDDAGQLVFLDFYDFRRYRLSKALPALDFRIRDETELSATHFLIASDRGGEVYEFDASGRHLRTLDPATGRELLVFDYDEESGLLTSITDKNDLVTTIERDDYNPSTGEGGHVTQIVAPTGQVTELRLNDDDFLEEIENPNGEIRSFMYAELLEEEDPDKLAGLIAGITDAEGVETHALTYDFDGTLRAVSSTNGSYELDDAAPLGDPAPIPPRSSKPRVASVATGTPLGRRQQFEFHETKEDPRYKGLRSQLALQQDAAGLRSRILTVGTLSWSRESDGTVLTSTAAPDPQWGSQTPFVRYATVTTPGGRTLTVEITADVEFKDEADHDGDGKIDDPTKIERRDVTVKETPGSGVPRISRAQLLEEGTLLRETSPGGRITETSFDEQGRPERVKIGSLEPTFYQYNDEGRIETILRGNRRTSLEYDGKFRLTAIVDPLGHRTEFRDYDEAGRPHARLDPDAGLPVRMRYDDNGNLLALAPPGISPDDVEEVHSFAYNSLSDPTNYAPPNPRDESAPVVDYCRISNCYGDPDVTAVPGVSLMLAPGGAIFPAARISWHYDRDRELVRTQLPVGRIVHARDGAGRLRRNVSVSTKVDYFYDSAGRLESLLADSGLGQAPGTVSYEWDGSLLETETSAYGSDPREVIGELQSSVIEYDYDGYLRPSLESLDGRDVVSHWTADDRPWQVGALGLIWDGDGLPQSASLGQLDEVFDFDLLGELKTRTVKCRGRECYVVEILERDGLGRIRLKRETFANMAAPTSGASDVRVTEYVYDAQGRLVREQLRVLGTYAVSGNRIGGLGAVGPRTRTVAYEYDDSGNRLSRVEEDTLGTGGSRTSYTYDAQDRLAGRHYDQPSDPYGPEDFAYLHDNAGRLTQVVGYEKSDREGAEQPAPWPARREDQREYNLSGRLAQAVYPAARLDAGAAGLRNDYYRWDAAGRLVAIYRFSAAGGTTPALHRQFVWSGSRLVAMYGLDDEEPLQKPPELLARFVYVPGGRVPQYAVYPPGTILNPDTGDGLVEKTYRFVTDQVGSIRLVIDAEEGTLQQRLDYDAFGNVMLDSRPEFQPFGFAAGIYLRGPNLVRFGARDYDPLTGRWTAKDPILFAGGQDNLYVYCGNDPVNCVDPSGLAYDAVDVGFFLISAAEFAAAPSLSAFGWLVGDAFGLLPGVPAPSWLRRGIGLADDVADGARLAGRADDALDVLRVGEREVDVYLAYNRAGEPAYVGITKALGERKRAHLRAGFAEVRKLTTSPITRREARGLEQLIISRNPQFLNSINSISSRRSWYNIAVLNGLSIARTQGIRLVFR